MGMLALGLYTFVVSVYGFLISSRENRCLISLVAVLLTLAFAGQIFSLFTALQLRYVVSVDKQRRNKVWTDLQIWRDGCLEILQIKIRNEVMVVLVVYMMVGVAMAVLELVTVAVACAYVAQITRRIRHKTRGMSGASSDTEDMEDWQSSVSGSLRKDFNFKSNL